MEKIKVRNKRVIILPDAKMDYAPEQIDKFIRLWNEGYSLGLITSMMGGIAKYEAALLVMHCDLYGLIQERPGGVHGTIAKRRKEKREMMKISL